MSKFSIDIPRPNFFKHRTIAEDSILVTVDSGEWAILSSKEFECLCHNDYSDPGLREKLYESHIYLDKNNWDSYIETMAQRWKEVFTRPTLHIVVVTPRCNLRCIYCHASYQQESNSSMSIETASKVLDRIFEVAPENFAIEFQGGEPTLNFETIKFMVEKSKELTEKYGKKVNFTIVTNFTSALTDEKMRFLIENSIDVSTSIDGPQFIHENNRNRNYPGGFSILCQKVHRFTELWKEIRDDEPRLSAMLTATKPVLAYPRETVDTYLSLGINDIFIRPVNPLGRGEQDINELTYPIEDFLEYWERVIDYIIELRGKGFSVAETHLVILLRKIFFRENTYMDLRSPCGASFGQRTYNYDGKIFTCDEGRMLEQEKFCLGTVDVKSSSINSSKNGIHTFISSLSELSYCEFCVYKPFCGVCPLLNYKTSGYTNTTIWNSRRCKLYRGMFDIIFRKFINEEKARKVFGDMIIESI